MEESKNNPIITSIAPKKLLDLKSPSPYRKNLRKRARNYDNLYGDNFEGLYFLNLLFFEIFNKNYSWK